MRVYIHVYIGIHILCLTQHTRRACSSPFVVTFRLPAVLTVPRPSFTYSTTFVVLRRHRRLRLYTCDTAAAAAVVGCDRSERSITRAQHHTSAACKVPRQAARRDSRPFSRVRTTIAPAAPADNLRTRPQCFLVGDEKTNGIIVGSLSYVYSARGVGEIAFSEFIDFVRSHRRTIIILYNRSPLSRLHANPSFALGRFPSRYGLLSPRRCLIVFFITTN